MNNNRALREATCRRIRSLCQERNLTLNGLCLQCGMTQSTLENFFHCHTYTPGIATIKIVCDGLGITLREFFATPDFDGLINESL